MQLRDRLNGRFVDLNRQIDELPIKSGGLGPYYDPAEWREWATSAENLILAATGKESPHMLRFKEAYENCDGSAPKFKALIGVFRSAKADFDGDFLFRVEAHVSGEIFADFVVLAKTALRENSKDVAAVLACAALEDVLKRFASLNGLQVDDQDMQTVVAALKSKGLVSGAQKSLLDTMPKIRDYAMHANWSKITSQDVGSVIGFVEQVLLTHFK